RVEREGAGHLKDPRGALGALDVAPQPEAVVGDARDHASSCSTHVSFEPPPWLELTTYEPSRSATRVSPPGSTHAPPGSVGTNRRRSTRRGASVRLAASHVGHVDSSIRRWAT